MTNYAERLKISITGNPDTIFKTDSGLWIARGYRRVVIGGRGPYIEFDKSHFIDMSLLAIPPNRLWRLNNANVYYVEWRTTDNANVKVYQQVREVDYANYVIGLYYISPFALSLADDTRVIVPLRQDGKHSE